MSTCADAGSVIESKKSVVQTSNVGFTSEVSDYLVVHTGPAPGMKIRAAEGGGELCSVHTFVVYETYGFGIL